MRHFISSALCVLTFGFAPQSSTAEEQRFDAKLLFELTSTPKRTPSPAALHGSDRIAVWFEDPETLEDEVLVFDAINGADLGHVLPQISELTPPFPLHTTASEKHVAAQLQVSKKGYLHYEVVLLSAEDFSVLHRFPTPAGMDRLGWGIGIALSETRIAITGLKEDSRDGLIYLYDTHTGARVAEVKDPFAPTGLFSFASSYDLAWPGDIALNSTTLAATAVDITGKQSGKVALFDAQTGAFTGELERPQEGGPSYFGVSLALDEERLFVGSENRTNVRILLDRYARSGEVTAYALEDLSPLYTLQDPVSLADDTPNAALAAALGQEVPFYGTKFGTSLLGDGTRLYVNMTDYPVPVAGAGAVGVYDAASGVSLGLLQSPKPQKNSNFFLLDSPQFGRLVTGQRAYDLPGAPSSIQVFAGPD